MKTNNLIQSKIYDFHNEESKGKLSRKIAFWQFKGQQVVFTNGCFDILHLGHIDYLSKAANLGDVLIIGLNTDRSVRRIKGESRPINHEYARAMLLASLGFVDAVVLFDDETPYELIKFVSPQILVKGSDYEPEKIVGYDIVKENGGDVVTIDFLDGFSTTTTIKKMKQS